MCSHCLDVLSGKEEDNSAIDSECEENDVIAKQIDDTGQLVSENDENPTADVIDGRQCSSAHRKSLVNVTVDGVQRSTSKNRSCSRVLTSSESIAMLEEKARKKGRSKRKKNEREKIENSKKLLKRSKRDKKYRKDKLSKPRSRRKLRRKGLEGRKETVHQMHPKVSGKE